MNELVKNYGKHISKTTPAPEVTPNPLTPSDKLKTLMSDGSWGLLQSLMAWGIMWEDMQDGTQKEFGEAQQNVMLSPFTFFGTNAKTWVAMASSIIPTLMYHIEQYRSDVVYARSNPMPWLVLQVCGPLLSQYDFGPSGMRETMKVVAELRDINELPN